MFTFHQLTLIASSNLYFNTVIFGDCLFSTVLLVSSSLNIIAVISTASLFVNFLSSYLRQLISTLILKFSPFVDLLRHVIKICTLIL